MNTRGFPLACEIRIKTRVSVREAIERRRRRRRREVLLQNTPHLFFCWRDRGRKRFSLCQFSPLLRRQRGRVGGSDISGILRDKTRETERVEGWKEQEQALRHMKNLQQIRAGTNGERRNDWARCSRCFCCGKIIETWWWDCQRHQDVAALAEKSLVQQQMHADAVL